MGEKMPLYRYNALTLDGKKQTGKAEAAGTVQLASFLRSENLFLVDSTLLEKISTYRKLTTLEVADFCRQLGAMLSSGINLIRAMMILAQRDTKEAVRKVHDALIEDLQRGSTLSEAMALRGRAFPELLINMIRAGEQTGRLDESCMKMANQYEKDHRLNSKIKSAMMYPIFLICLIVAVVLIIFTFVIPRFTSMYQGMELPAPTRIVMAVSDFMLSSGVYLVICIIVAIFALIALFRQPAPRRGLDHMKIKLPKIGKLLQTIYTARFARTLSSLYVSGIPMIHALTIAQSTVGNKYIESQFREVIEHLGNGRTLSQAISVVDGFEMKLKSTILIGEESGRLESMLESVADQFDYDSEMATQRMVAMLEPMFIIIMAFVVGFVVVSVLLPIFSLYSAIGGEGGI